MQLTKYFHKYGINAYITPMADNHLNEFISAKDNAVAKLTGFSGTAGTAVEFEDFRALLTDGRYYVQASKELTDYELIKSGEISLAETIKAQAPARIGADASLFAYSYWESLKSTLEKEGIELIDVDGLLEAAGAKLDEKDFQPITDMEEFIYEAKDGTIAITHHRKALGKASQSSRLTTSLLLAAASTGSEKLVLEDNDKIAEALIGNNVTGSTRGEKFVAVRKLIGTAEGLLITELDTIAWLFNMRGSDIIYNTVFYAYAFITMNEALLFTDGATQIPGVRIKRYNQFPKFLETIKNKKVIISANCNARIGLAIKEKEFVLDVRRQQAKKNSIELYGMLRANLLDGAALAALFEWIEENNDITEKQVSEKLEAIKKEYSDFISVSFNSIVGFGTNSSQMHHTSSDTKLAKGDMILIDSGSQYRHGTTDITRSLTLDPSPDQCEKYTYVLKAVLASKMLKRDDIDSEKVDAAARSLLEAKGITYNSATSHGVGAGLVVHEKPPFGSKFGTDIAPNSVFTIEPGYYEESKFGIRIEDTVVYLEDNEQDYPLVNLAYVPLHRRLINTSMLTKDEIVYLNEYNKITRRLLLQIIKDGKGKGYLLANTEPIAVK